MDILICGITSFIFGVLVDRFFLVKWFDQISRHRLKLVLQFFVGSLLVLIFAVVMLHSLTDSDYHVDKEFYYVIIVISGSIFGMDAFKDLDVIKKYIKK